MKPTNDDRLLIGSATGDDAAVWRLDDDRCLVFTADFITPLVDDARTWGRIAAANSVSDIYAMGGEPLLALNLVGWNSNELSNELLGEVLQGGSEVATEAGFVVGGGHTIDDPEPKFGMAVVGQVHPSQIITNSGMKPNQDLVLTKPLGIGVVATAIKQGKAPEGVVAEAIAEMCRLNAAAAKVAVAAGVTGGTDITGFGLLGHLGRAVTESQVDVVIDVASVPLLDGVVNLASAGFVPGGSRRNLDWVMGQLQPHQVDPLQVVLLADAQTSGGLLLAVDASLSDSVVGQLVEQGHSAAIIGRTTAGSGMISLEN